MRRTAVAGAAALALMATGAARPPATDVLAIAGVTTSGPGCPRGSVLAEAHGDHFTIIFSAFTATAGPSATNADLSRQCTVAVRVRLPEKRTFAATAVTQRGFTDLASGATARSKRTFWWSAGPTTSMVLSEYRGPLDTNWATDDEVATETGADAPCGGTTTFNAELQLTASAPRKSSEPALFTLDSVDGALSRWSDC
ncbi:DUF4360 domain-containing protein [Catenuloplanes atrovinosus]|uniref:Secreted protein n=1 Tax=Catenuloplanes atrovinosus TaxID=137266 RepID=A0AAE4CAU1_9ACTN|nr:DUF4360 domain-containing protein [Catenuloplanes atrovinosus]MDR7276179.1 hypothetical protein [Catenuloplanes atrovinosus]